MILGINAQELTFIDDRKLIYSVHIIVYRIQVFCSSRQPLRIELILVCPQNIIIIFIN